MHVQIQLTQQKKTKQNVEKKQKHKRNTSQVDQYNTNGCTKTSI